MDACVSLSEYNVCFKLERKSLWLLTTEINLYFSFQFKCFIHMFGGRDFKAFSFFARFYLYFSFQTKEMFLSRSLGARH